MATKMTKEEAIKILMGYSHTPQERAALEVLIPELAESEDEKIRKRLIEYFEGFRIDNAEVKWEGLIVQEVLVWLEKQKECVSNNFDDVWDEEDCEEIIAEGQKLTPRFKELLKEVCHAWYDRGAKLEKQKGQKPAWSEDDEKKIRFLSRLIEFQVKDGEYCFGEGSRAISKQEAIEMLKSLRPHWKPSEEQMNGLAHSINLDVYDAKRYGLDSLYNDLKKLM